MARYDRDFLVPYLRDICSLHMAKAKLDRMIWDSEREIERLNTNAQNSIAPPDYEVYAGGQGDLTGTGTGCIGGILCLFALFGLFGAMFSGGSATTGLGLMLAFAIPGIAIAFWSFGSVDRKNAAIQKHNDELEQDYLLQQVAAMTLVQPQVKQIEQRIQYLINECDKIDELLAQNYSLNIIPGWYRDMYPAVYLYDWFRNSRADDMDMALNTFVLEQIKEKLDIIIRNQSEELLNQRIIIANQNQSMRQAEQHHAELMNKLNRMQAADEERNTYLRMIETNTAVDAYFSVANYLKS